MTEMSVRQWQERFRAGDFNSRDLSVQCEAGWFDWFCRNDALAGRLKKLSSAVLGIKAPFILDNYYVWFKNNCPMAGPLYDDVRFEPLSGEREGKYFVITLDCPHELAKWVLYTERYGYDAPEFCSGNVRDMRQYINSMAAELEQGIQPAFLLEKRAVSKYIFRHEGEHGIPVYRDREHEFSYISRKDRQLRKVMVTDSMEALPRGTGGATREAVCVWRGAPYPRRAHCPAENCSARGAGAMKEQNQVRPGLPPDARAEILETLSANMEIGSDEIVAILKRHYVAEDTGILQDRYRRQLGQRLMASLRDDDGRREVMSNGKGRYFVLECCRDQRQLQSVQRRIQNQMRGLDATAGKVRVRIRVLDRLKSVLMQGKRRKAG